MSIFLNDAYRRQGIIYQGASRGDSQGIADHFSARLGSRMGRMASESSLRTDELTSDFNEFGLENLYDDRNKQISDEAQKLSTEGAAFVLKSKASSPAKSESEYVRRTMQRRQTLQQAKRKLEKANELYKNVGSSFRFEETGYTALNEDAKQFYSQFDQQIAERQASYASMYGYKDFDSLNEGYGAGQDFSINFRNMTEEEQAQYIEYFGDPSEEGHAVNLDPYGEFSGGSVGGAIGYGANEARRNFIRNYIESGRDARIGQRDIMDMIMSDLTGISSGDLGRLNLYDGGGGLGNPQSYTEDQMAGLREFYATSGVAGIRNANEKARLEDEFRRKAAIDAATSATASQKGMGKAASQSIGETTEGIQMQLRELDERFMKNIGSFRSAPKKRKVPKISFTEGRPV
tara:strand:- start:13797 stop:15008 length:1212 start_codon:yes stop_codon:yes gene_type:complete